MKLWSDAGHALAGVTRAVSAVRPAAKPLHPRGTVVVGELRRTGLQRPTGAAWLDEPGVDPVLVRRSRAVGLPSPLPDIHGLALRVTLADGGHGDLLLASTGLGRVTRFVLTGSRSPYRRPFTTLLPYRTPGGPVLIAARAADPDSYELACAGPATPWRGFGRLTLAREPGVEQLISFDPLLHELPGLQNYGWVRRLREPAYLVARHSRR